MPVFNVTDAGSNVVPMSTVGVNTITTTGNLDNQSFSNATLVRMNNASLSTIRGLAAGVDGQEVEIVSIGGGQVDIKDQDTNSTAANRIITGIGGTLSLAAGYGTMRLVYDGTTQRWRVVAHEQGAWISYTPTWTGFTTNPSLGNGTLTGAYYRRGKVVHYKIKTVWGSTTTNGSGVFFWTLPFTALDTQAYSEPSGATLNNHLVGQYIAQVQKYSSTQIYVMTDANPNGVSGTNQWNAFANTDSILIAGTYEA